jgi:Mn2+/Fe2+ NRAMP family transporter
MPVAPSEQLELLLDEAERSPTIKKLWIWTQLSGPGWLQGAITLGGGSLAGSLYLGVLMGYGFMWLQPLAMILGVVMLSAISYVTISTQVKPFDLIRMHVSPVMAWAWLLATILANVTWSLPQYALGTAAIQQNLVPALGDPSCTMAVTVGLFLISYMVVWFYDSGGVGIRVFDWILKLLVGMVVVCFFAVVGAMTVQGLLPWRSILLGLIPHPNSLFEPAPTLQTAIDATGPMASWWTAEISAMQKDIIITGFATAVGINMTFMLPYSMLQKNWNRKHRGLAIYDLGIGLIIPFVAATGCVVIASASQFHANPEDVLQKVATGKGKETSAFNQLVDARLAADSSVDFATVRQSDSTLASARAALPEADRRLAAMLAARDNLALAKTLQPLVGERVSQTLFGLGVIGMAVSTIIMLMVINGIAICTLLNVESGGWTFRLGALLPAVGMLGPFYWASAAPALATPTSVICGAVLPIAYLTFLLLMNSRAALGDAMPQGKSRWIWNVLMLTATLVAIFGSAWGMIGKQAMGLPIGNVSLLALIILAIIGVMSFISRNRSQSFSVKES